MFNLIVILKNLIKRFSIWGNLPQNFISLNGFFQKIKFSPFLSGVFSGCCIGLLMLTFNIYPELDSGFLTFISYPFKPNNTGGYYIPVPKSAELAYRDKSRSMKDVFLKVYSPYYNSYEKVKYFASPCARTGRGGERIIFNLIFF